MTDIKLLGSVEINNIKFDSQALSKLQQSFDGMVRSAKVFSAIDQDLSQMNRQAGNLSSTIGTVQRSMSALTAIRGIGSGLKISQVDKEFKTLVRTITAVEKIADKVSFGQIDSGAAQARINKLYGVINQVFGKTSVEAETVKKQLEDIFSNRATANASNAAKKFKTDVTKEFQDTKNKAVQTFTSLRSEIDRAISAATSAGDKRGVSNLRAQKRRLDQTLGKTKGLKEGDKSVAQVARQEQDAAQKLDKIRKQTTLQESKNKAVIQASTRARKLQQDAIRDSIRALDKYIQTAKKAESAGGVGKGRVQGLLRGQENLRRSLAELSTTKASGGDDVSSIQRSADARRNSVQAIETQQAALEKLLKIQERNRKADITNQNTVSTKRRADRQGRQDTFGKFIRGAPDRDKKLQDDRAKAAEKLARESEKQENKINRRAEKRIAQEQKAGNAAAAEIQRRGNAIEKQRRLEISYENKILSLVKKAQTQLDRTAKVRETINVKVTQEESILRKIVALENKRNLKAQGKALALNPDAAREQLRAYDQVINKQRRFNAGQTQLAAHSLSMKKFADQIGLAAKRYSAFLIGSFAIFALRNAFRTSIAEALEFEKVITKIEQVIGNIDKISLGNIRDEILSTAKATGIAAKEIAAGIQTFAQAGFKDATQLASVAEQLAKASLAPTFGNIQETAEGLIAVFGQFNKSLGDTSYLLDLINQFAADFAVSSQDIFESVKRGGAAFSTAGGSVEEYIELFTILRESTRETARTLGTFFKTGLARILQPSSQELLEQIGVDTGRGVVDQLRQLSTVFASGQLSGRQKLNISRDLVGQRQFARLAALLREINDETTKLRIDKAFRQAAGSLDRSILKRLDDVGQSLARIRESFLAFGKEVLDDQSLRQFASGIANVSESLANLSTTIAPLIPIVLALGSAFLVKKGIVPALAALGGKVGVFKEISKAGRAFRTTPLTTIDRRLPAGGPALLGAGIAGFAGARTLGKSEGEFLGTGFNNTDVGAGAQFGIIAASLTKLMGGTGLSAAVIGLTTGFIALNKSIKDNQKLMLKNALAEAKNIEDVGRAINDFKSRRDSQLADQVFSSQGRDVFGAGVGAFGGGAIARGLKFGGRGRLAGAAIGAGAGFGGSRAVTGIQNADDPELNGLLTTAALFLGPSVVRGGATGLKKLGAGNTLQERNARIRRNATKSGTLRRFAGLDINTTNLNKRINRFGTFRGVGATLGGAAAGGAAGTLAGAALRPDNISQAEEKNRKLGNTIGTVAGTVIGGVLGTFFGPGGTAIGAFLGGGVGGALGELIGGSLEGPLTLQQRAQKDARGRAESIIENIGPILQQQRGESADDFLKRMEIIGGDALQVELNQARKDLDEDFGKASARSRGRVIVDDLLAALQGESGSPLFDARDTLISTFRNEFSDITSDLERQRRIDPSLSADELNRRQKSQQRDRIKAGLLKADPAAFRELEAAGELDLAISRIAQSLNVLKIGTKKFIELSPDQRLFAELQENANAIRSRIVKMVTTFASTSRAFDTQLDALDEIVSDPNSIGKVRSPRDAVKLLEQVGASNLGISEEDLKLVLDREKQVRSRASGLGAFVGDIDLRGLVEEQLLLLGDKESSSAAGFGSFSERLNQIIASANEGGDLTTTGFDSLFKGQNLTKLKEFAQVIDQLAAAQPDKSFIDILGEFFGEQDFEKFLREQNISEDSYKELSQLAAQYNEVLQARLDKEQALFEALIGSNQKIFELTNSLRNLTNQGADRELAQRGFEQGTPAVQLQRLQAQALVARAGNTQFGGSSSQSITDLINATKKLLDAQANPDSDKANVQQAQQRKAIAEQEVTQRIALLGDRIKNAAAAADLLKEAFNKFDQDLIKAGRGIQQFTPEEFGKAKGVFASFAASGGVAPTGAGLGQIIGQVGGALEPLSKEQNELLKSTLGLIGDLEIADGKTGNDVLADIDKSFLPQVADLLSAGGRFGSSDEILQRLIDSYEKLEQEQKAAAELEKQLRQEQADLLKAQLKVATLLEQFLQKELNDVRNLNPDTPNSELAPGQNRLPVDSRPDNNMNPASPGPFTPDNGFYPTSPGQGLYPVESLPFLNPNIGTPQGPVPYGGFPDLNVPHLNPGQAPAPNPSIIGGDPNSPHTFAGEALTGAQVGTEALIAVASEFSADGSTFKNLDQLNSIASTLSFMHDHTAAIVAIMEGGGTGGSMNHTIDISPIQVSVALTVPDVVRLAGPELKQQIMSEIGKELAVVFGADPQAASQLNSLGT